MSVARDQVDDLLNVDFSSRAQLKTACLKVLAITLYLMLLKCDL